MFFKNKIGIISFYYLYFISHLYIVTYDYTNLNGMRTFTQLCASTCSYSVYTYTDVPTHSCPYCDVKFLYHYL